MKAGVQWQWFSSSSDAASFLACNIWGITSSQNCGAQPSEQGLGSARRLGPAAVSMQIDLAERQSGLATEAIRVGEQVRLELRLRGLLLRGDVFGEELELLLQAATDDRIVAVEAHGQRLTIEDFLADLLLDQPTQLIRRRRAQPEARERKSEALNLGQT